MRDFRDAKTMAQALRAALAAKGLKISVGDSLELVARLFGQPDWNTLSAAIKAAPKDAAPPDPKDLIEQLAKSLGNEGWRQLLTTIRTNAAAAGEPAPDLPPGPPIAPGSTRRTGTFFSEALEKTLHRAVAEATTRHHEYTTLEHLLLALTDDPDVAAVMTACQVDIPALRTVCTRYVDEELGSLVKPDRESSGPTAGFHRVVQRAVIHVQSSGRQQVTGANLLVAVFSEQESHAAFFLQQQKMTRWDAVNFIAHGIRKDGAAA